MFGRALETGETRTAGCRQAHTDRRGMARAGRFDEALEACAAAETEPGLMLNEPDDEDERVRTATVATFVRNLAIAGR